MQKRNSIMKLSCDYLEDIETLRKNGSHDDLLQFHEKIFNLDLPPKNKTLKDLRYSV